MSLSMHLWMNTKLASRRLCRRCLECQRLLLRGVLAPRKLKVLCPLEQQWQTRICSLYFGDSLIDLYNQKFLASKYFGDRENMAGPAKDGLEKCGRILRKA